jgi:GTPase
VRSHRSRHRAQRDRAGIPLIALVGYTNAGKSTLLRALTGADVYIANQLFATLDPTTRRIDLPSGRQALISDTVGFIQKLPTTLIAAFRATLEEINDADIILEVTDVNHSNVLQHIESVEDTLAEIDVPPVPRVLVWNKADLRGDQPPPTVPNPEQYVAQVSISATKATGLNDLLEAIETALAKALYRVTLRFPYERGDLVSLLHEAATVEEQIHTEDGVVLKLRLPRSLYERFKEYQV